jgi:hypothetical protein
MDEIDTYFQLIESWANRTIGELSDWIDPLTFLIKQLRNRLVKFRLLSHAKRSFSPLRTWTSRVLLLKATF